jgi:hypothetical protein
VTVDYRAQRSPSPEGSGAAKAAWEHFHLDLARDLTEEAYAVGAVRHAGDPPPEALDEIRATVIEESELLGFWLAWWRAGGFAGLEGAGWNRATIFRKLRRYRTRFGTHPDDHHPSWITLDLHTVWADALRARIDETEP